MCQSRLRRKVSMIKWTPEVLLSKDYSVSTKILFKEIFTYIWMQSYSSTDIATLTFRPRSDRAATTFDL